MCEAVAGRFKDSLSDASGGDWEVLEVDVPGPGLVVATVCGDEELVVWRTAFGDVCVMDARCPHQWSHLAQEGTVDGGELVCMTHFWRFTTEGEGWKINMDGRRDRKGDIGTYSCREADGRIWIKRET